MPAHPLKPGLTTRRRDPSIGGDDQHAEAALDPPERDGLLVAEGQEIGEDDPLVEIQTDKTTVEIPSPAAGKVARILVREGDTVAVGTVLVVIGEDGTSSDDEQPRAEEAPQKQTAASDADVSSRLPTGRGPSRQRARATPLVRRLAQELGVDLETLAGSGPQGRITEEDVRAAAVSPDLAPGHAPEGHREPLRGVRRLIAEHMARAHAEVPPVTWVEECDFGAVDLKRLVPLTLGLIVACLLWRSARGLRAPPGAGYV